MEKASSNFSKLSDDRYRKLYRIHHLHHFSEGKYIKHETHHCFLFGGKNMKGKRFRVFHKIQDENFWHCVAGVPGANKLYDHKNNIYKIYKIKNKQKYFFAINF